MSKLRKEDERLEKVIANYLDRNLYTLQNGLFPASREGIGREQEVQGIDIATYIDGCGYFLADEKMAVRYINKNIDTFSLELKTLNRKGNEMIGWFLDEKKKNTHFVLGWINAKKDSDIAEDDIQQIEIIVVNKLLLKSHFENKIDFSKIDEYYNFLSTGGNTKQLNKKLALDMDKDKFIAYHSPHLFEKPLNLIVKKELLISLADKHLFI